MQTREVSFQRRISPELSICRNGGKFSDILIQQVGFLDPPKHSLYGSMRIVSCRLPVAFYNVPSGRNGIRFQRDNNPTETVYVDTGNYSYRTLSTAINNALQNKNISVSFQSSSGKFLFESSHSFTLFFDDRLTMTEVLGFASQTQFTSTQSNNKYIILSEYLPNLQGDTVAIFRTPSLVTNNINVSDLTSYIVAIPLNAPLFGVATWDNLTNFSIPLDPKLHLNQFEIFVTNAKGVLLDFQLVPWELIMEISYTVEVREMPRDPLLFNPIKKRRLIEKPDQENPQPQDNEVNVEEEQPTEEHVDENEQQELLQKNNLENNVDAAEEDGQEQVAANNSFANEDQPIEKEESQINTIEKNAALKFPQFQAPFVPDTAFDLSL